MSEIRGVITAMATPFEPDGAVDEAAARKLAGYLVEHGSHGVVVAGSTGEAATLDDDEHIALLAAIVDEVGAEATVICGTGTNDTRHSVELTKAAAEAGADGGPGRHAVLQQAQPRRDPRPLRGDRRGRPGPAPDRLQHPLAGGDQRAARPISPSWPRSTASSRSSRRTTTSSARSRASALLAGNDDVFLRDAGARRRRWDPRRLAPGRRPRMREMWDAAQAGELERAREIDAELRPALRRDGRRHQPDPAQGGAGDGRPDPPRRPATADGSSSTPTSAPSVREALDAVGVPVAS